LLKDLTCRMLFLEVVVRGLAISAILTFNLLVLLYRFLFIILSFEKEEGVCIIEDKVCPLIDSISGDLHFFGRFLVGEYWLLVIDELSSLLNFFNLLWKRLNFEEFASSLHLGDTATFRSELNILLSSFMKILLNVEFLHFVLHVKLTSKFGFSRIWSGLFIFFLTCIFSSNLLIILIYTLCIGISSHSARPLRSWTNTIVNLKIKRLLVLTSYFMFYIHMKFKDMH